MTEYCDPNRPSAAEFYANGNCVSGDDGQASDCDDEDKNPRKQQQLSVVALIALKPQRLKEYKDILLKLERDKHIRDDERQRLR